MCIFSLSIGFKGPDRRYYNQVAIPKKYVYVVDLMEREMQAGAYFSVTSDGWSSAVNMNPYVYLTNHYIDANWIYRFLNFETLFAPVEPHW